MTQLTQPIQLDSDHQFTDDHISTYDYYMQKSRYNDIQASKIL
jgi:hypothetical protein